MASPHLYASGDVRLTTAPIPHSDLPLPEPFLSPARVRVPAALNSVIGAWCRHFGGPGSLPGLCVRMLAGSLHVWGL